MDCQLHTRNSSHWIQNISGTRDKMCRVSCGGPWKWPRRSITVRVSRMCYTILFKHIPS